MDDLGMIIIRLNDMLANTPTDSLAADIRALRDSLRTAKQERYDMQNQAVTDLDNLMARIS